MCISDWVSDVCSSDLIPTSGRRGLPLLAEVPGHRRPGLEVVVALEIDLNGGVGIWNQIGPADSPRQQARDRHRIRVVAGLQGRALSGKQGREACQVVA